MPATASRKRNRAALTGERYSSKGKGKARHSDSSPSNLRRLLLVLLLTTLALVSLQVYRVYARGTLLPPSYQSRLSSLRSTWEELLHGGAQDDKVAYDSSQWKARVNKVVTDTSEAAKDRIKRAQEEMVELSDDKLPITAEELKNLDMQDIQKMFDMLQTASRGRNSADGEDEEDEDAGERAQEERQNSRKERFGRLRKAMGFNEEQDL